MICKHWPSNDCSLTDGHDGVCLTAYEASVEVLGQRDEIARLTAEVERLRDALVSANDEAKECADTAWAIMVAVFAALGHPSGPLDDAARRVVAERDRLRGQLREARENLARSEARRQTAFEARDAVIHELATRTDELAAARAEVETAKSVASANLAEAHAWRRVATIFLDSTKEDHTGNEVFEPGEYAQDAFNSAVKKYGHPDYET